MKIYSLKNKFEKGFVNCNISDIKDFPNRDNLIIRGDDVVDNLTFVISEGKKIPDWIWTSGLFYYLFSKRVFDLFRKNNITGWDSYSVSILGNISLELNSFEGLVVKGRCGSILYEKENIIEKQVSPSLPPFKFYKGYKIDRDKWDGKDVFMPNNTNHIFVSEKVYEILIDAKVTNIKMEDIDEILVPV
jgi:hypothetical protein